MYKKVYNVKLIVDTVAMVTFSFIVGLCVELLISGLTLSQSLQSRLTSIPVNFFTARPYGMYRDWLFKKFSVSEDGRLRKILVDTCAFITFQVPLYIIILFLAGANRKQILSSCISVTIASACMGGPYGMYLDFLKRIFHVPQNIKEIK